VEQSLGDFRITLRNYDADASVEVQRNAVEEFLFRMIRVT
jgi:hypothetical protein